MQKSFNFTLKSKSLVPKLHKELLNTLKDSTNSYFWPNQVCTILSQPEAKAHYWVQWKTVLHHPARAAYRQEQAENHMTLTGPDDLPSLRIDLPTEPHPTLGLSVHTHGGCLLRRAFNEIVTLQLFKCLQSNLATWQTIHLLPQLPEPIDLRQGTYFFCTCQRSSTWPFCDGAHKHSAYSPVPYRVGRDGERIRFCRCLKSQDWPVCDDSHAAQGLSHDAQ